MKNIISISLIGAFLFAGNALPAQEYPNPDAARYLMEDHTRAGVNSNCYEFAPIQDTPAPKGFKPFYISHYGRHGSRSDWGGKNYEHLEKILSEGKEQGILTAGGDSLLAMTREVIRHHDDMDGRLTPKGIYEHKMLAERMYQRFKPVFTKGSKKILAVSSVVPRCMLSMTAFTDRLTEIDPNFDIMWDAGEKFQAYIDNSGLKEIDDAVYRRIDSIYVADMPDTVSIIDRLFTDHRKGCLVVGDPLKLEKDIFAAGRVTDPFEMDADILGFLPFDALYHNWENINLNHYMRQCNSIEYGTRRTERAVKLIDDIVSKADAAINTGEYAADLRFGHDYPAMTLISYLGMEGAGDRYTLEGARKHFNGSEYFPFSMNIQLIFYRNKVGDVLVKFLLNEKETLLRGLAPVQGPYYDWNTVKANIKGYLR